MVIWKRRDLLTIAGSMIICGLMGLPPCYGLFPQIRPCEFTRKLDNIPTSDMESQEMFSQESQREELGAQRACGLLSSIILGIPLLPGPASLVKNIPQPLLWGFCLQMGVNKLRRLWMNHNLRKCSDVEGQRSWAKKAYVVIQTVCVGVIFSISRTQAALLFPLFLLTALWLRHYVMGKAFDYKQETKASKANGEAGRHQSGELRDREKNWDDGKPKIRWLRRKRKRQPSLDVGLSSVSSSLRFVMRARETQKRRRNRSRSSVIYVGEEDSVDVHSNFLYDAGGSTSGLGFHCLDCRDVSVAEEAVSLKGSTISFEDWAHPPSNPPFPSSHSL